MKNPSKNILISAVAFVTFCVPVTTFGQTTLDIRGGLSRATISGIDDQVVKALMGLALGVSATMPIQDNFGLRLDGGYVQKGYGFEVFGIEGDANIDYIELSGFGVANLIPAGSPASVYALAGPSVAFNTGCEVTASNGDSESCGEEARGIDLGITGGIGANMSVSEQMTLSVELRYTLGLQSVDETGDEEFKNRDLILQVGIGFPIGKEQETDLSR